MFSSNERIILAGDINIHLDQDELYSNRFKDIFDMFNICQYVNFPTHKLGHTIDMIATFDNNPVISNLEANEYDVSHHFLIDFDVAIHPEIRKHKTIWYRNIKMINSEEFQQKVTEKLTVSACLFGREYYLVQ